MKKLILLIIIISTLVFSACGKEDLPYTTEKIEAPEESASKYVMYDPIDNIEDTKWCDMTFESFKTDNITYWFDSTVEMDKRVKYVSDTYMVINYLVEKYNLTEIPEYYISPEFYNHIEKDTVYLKLDEESSCIEEFIIQTMFKLTDTKCNYGLIYGISKSIEDELNIVASKQEIIENSDISTFIEKNTEVMDLTLPVFITEYYKEEDIEKTKYIAKKFVKHISEKHGEDKLKELLLSSSELTLDFDKEYKKYCDEWLKSIGCNIALQDETLPVRYEIYGDEHYPIAIVTEWMTYCFHREFKDECAEITGYNGTYQNVKECIHTFEKEMKNVRDFWPGKYTKKYVEGYVSYFNNFNSFNEIHTQSTSHLDKIICLRLIDYLHEYTHTVSLSEFGYSGVTDKFIYEGLAQYCLYELSNYYREVELGHLVETKNANDGLLKKAYYIYSKCYGEDISDFNTLNFWEIVFYVNYRQKGKMLLEKKNYYYFYRIGPLFTNYLISNYGIDKYVSVFKDFADFYICYQKSFPDMKQEYIDYLFEKYEPYYE
ncbi:hypothetical protein JYG23_12905 [Sedimentibacter sp. zth1]|uniref:hypothetical protein n=1 Tax=Sedimentibacter sp. zth1 TaxID=2816908 RepID=UPI001A927590|nr:hypothetical protein [Sedimentibacter sp. zth1]QSX05559.1 hypothetical protein JYG23_12905 [Sedimentibacter sp. zth1]